MSDSEIVEAEPPGADEAEISYLRAIVQGMQDAVYVRDKDRTLLYMNPAAERLTGWGLDEALKHPCYNIFGDPDRRCNLDCPIDRAMVSGKPARHAEGTVALRDGKVVPVEVSITPLPKSADQTGAVVIVRNIAHVRGLEQSHLTVLREFEQSVRELKRDEVRFRDFAELSNEWLWETDAEHRFTLMTGTAFFAREKYIGHRRQDLVDVEADKAHWELFFKWLESEQPFTDFVYSVIGPDGEHGSVSISGKPVFDEKRAFIGYRGIGRNVSRDKVGG